MPRKKRDRDLVYDSDSDDDRGAKKKKTLNVQKKIWDKLKEIREREPFRIGRYSLYRKEGATKSFELHEFSDLLEKILDGNEDKKLYWSDIVARSKDQELMERVDLADLHHGDVVNFFDYRLCGAYYLYRTKRKVGGKSSQLVDDFLLIKAYGEFGYGVPIEFSDAPVSYWTHYHYLEHNVDPIRLFPGSELERVVTEEIEKRKAEPEYKGKTNYDYGAQTINLKEFPQNYVYIIEEGSGGWTTGWEFDRNLFARRFEAQQKAIETPVRLFLERIVGPYNVPAPIVEHIFHFIIQ